MGGHNSTFDEWVEEEKSSKILGDKIQRNKQNYFDTDHKSNRTYTKTEEVVTFKYCKIN